MSRYRLYLFLCMCLAGTGSFTAVRAQPVFELSGLSSSRKIFFTGNMAYFASEKELSIDSVVKIKAGRFIVSPDPASINFGFTKYYYWFRFSIINNTSTDRDPIFISGNSAINQLELFQISGQDATSLGRTGDWYPFSQRPYYFTTFCYPLHLKAGQRQDYLLFTDKKNENLEVGFFLAAPTAFKKYEHSIYLFAGLFSGILGLALLFNMFLFFYTKDRLHLWYCFYSLSAIALILAYKSLDFELFYPGHPFWSNVSRYCTSLVCTALLLSVMQSFLSQPASSRYHTIVFFSKWFFMIMAIIGVLIFRYYPYPGLKRAYLTLVSVLFLGSFLLIYLSCIERLRQGFKPALIYMIAVSTMLTAGILKVLTTEGVLPTFYSEPNLLEIGIVLEALIICFAILYRYQLFRERQQYLTLQLEQQKAEHTQQIIITQEREQKRIAEDLHDEMGGNLAAIKMNLLSMTADETKKARVIELIDKATHKARSISHNLMPPEFERTELQELLTHHYNQLNAECNLHFDYRSSGEKLFLRKDTELMIYRILLELTNNIVRHAGATEATVQLINTQHQLELMVEDNGCGFREVQGSGIGLINVRSRVNYLQGEMNIDSNAYGTTIIIKIPLN